MDSSCIETAAMEPSKLAAPLLLLSAVALSDVEIVLLHDALSIFCGNGHFIFLCWPECHDNGIDIGDTRLLLPMNEGQDKGRLRLSEAPLADIDVITDNGRHGDWNNNADLDEGWLFNERMPSPSVDLLLLCSDAYLTRVRRTSKALCILPIGAIELNCSSTDL